MRNLLGLLLVVVGCEAETKDCLLHSQCATAEQCIDGRCTLPPTPPDTGRAEAGPTDASPNDASLAEAGPIDASLADAVPLLDGNLRLDGALVNDVALGDSAVQDGSQPTDISLPEDGGLGSSDGGPVGEAGGAPLDAGPAQD